MKRFTLSVVTGATSLVVAAAVILLLLKFSPIQLMPENASFIVSPPGPAVPGAAAAVPKATVDYVSFVSILLSLISALLAALGLGLAILAIVGWNSVTGKVHSSAERVISESIESGSIKAQIGRALKEGGALFELVAKQSRQAMYDGVERVIPGDDSETK